MGKRKSKRKAPTKMKAKLATSFSCPFCNHENSIQVKMDKEHSIGYISCRICGADYQTPINNLSVAVDIYSDWIDACELSNQQQQQTTNNANSNNGRERRQRIVKDDDDDDDDERDDDDDDLDPY